MLRSVGIAGLAAAIMLTADGAAETPSTVVQLCMLKAELAADLVATDPRADDATLKARTTKSLRSFAQAQSRFLTARKETDYERAAAFGWDRNRVDAEHRRMGLMIEQTIAPVRSKGLLSSDLVMELHGCAGKMPGQLGQTRSAFEEALSQILRWAQKPAA